MQKSTSSISQHVDHGKIGFWLHLVVQCSPWVPLATRHFPLDLSLWNIVSLGQLNWPNPLLFAQAGWEIAGHLQGRIEGRWARTSCLHFYASGRPEWTEYLLNTSNLVWQAKKRMNFSESFDIIAYHSVMIPSTLLCGQMYHGMLWSLLTPSTGACSNMNWISFALWKGTHRTMIWHKTLTVKLANQCIM